jgi:hypothetical protein
MRKVVALYLLRAAGGSPVEQPLRVAEFDELFATAVRSAERLGSTGLRVLLPAGEERKRWTARTSRTSHAVEPIVRRAWLAPGVHVTSVGYDRSGREVDDATVADALVFVESGTPPSHRSRLAATT